MARPWPWREPGPPGVGKSGYLFSEDRLHRVHDPFSASFALLRSYRVWGETALALDVARSLTNRLPGVAVVEYEVAAKAAARFEEDGEIRQLEVMMRQLADFLGDLV